MRQNNNLFSLISQIKQNQLNHQPNRRQSDFDIFMEKFSKNGNGVNTNAQIQMPLGHQPPGLAMSQINVNSILESYRQAQLHAAAAAIAAQNGTRNFAFQQRNGETV